MAAERDLDLGRHHATLDAVIAVEIVILILIVVINSFIIAIFASHRRLRVSSNLHVMLICITDLLVGALLMPLILALEMRVLELSQWLCRFLEFLKYFTLTSNIYCVVLISVERLRVVMATQAVRRGGFGWQAARAACIFLLGAIYGGCVSSQYAKVIVPSQLEEGNSSTYSHEDEFCGFTQHGVHVIIVSVDFVLLSALPVLLTTVIYALIVNRARGHMATVNSQHVARAAKQRHVHLVQLAVTLVSLYAFCQVPIRIWSLVVVGRSELESGTEAVTDSLVLLAFCNSWLSSLAYAAFHRDFVHALRRLVPACRVHPHTGGTSGPRTTSLPLEVASPSVVQEQNPSAVY